MHLALYGRSFRSNIEEKLRNLLTVLSSRKDTISCYRGLIPYLKQYQLFHLINGEIYTSHEDLPSSVDLVLALGGDGTFLKALTIVKMSGIPVAGINFGRIGFLTSAQVNDKQGMKAVESILDSKYRVENRTLLQVSCEGLPDDFYQYALNEISIQSKGPYMIGIQVTIDDKTIPTYWADGLIVATSTGSTAYSLSIGGPVVMPGSKVFIISPMAPHNLNVRPLIVPDTVKIEISIKTEGFLTFLSADNRTLTLTQSESSSILISKAPFPIRCVSSGDAGFIEALNDRLLWGADLRNEIRY